MTLYLLIKIHFLCKSHRQYNSLFHFAFALIFFCSQKKNTHIEAKKRAKFVCQPLYGVEECKQLSKTHMEHLHRVFSFGFFSRTELNFDCLSLHTNSFMLIDRISFGFMNFHFLNFNFFVGFRYCCCLF